MKAIDIPYGKGKQTVHVPQERLTAILTPNHIAQANESQETIVKKALEAPIGTRPLHELAAGAKKVLFITSDHTRPMPSGITAPLMLEEIRRGSPEAEITILVATGLHRPTTAEELRARFGDAVVEKETILIHNARDTENMVFFGTLPSGGELWLNRMVADADLVVAEGFIEPHFFAGFSGGRKSILPGVAAEKTVLYNHNARFISDERARQGTLIGNPIHEDMAFAAKQAGLAFILNVLLDEDKRIVAAVAGDCEAAHARGSALCHDMAHIVPVEADIAITSNGGFPLDQNIYQAVKGMTGAEACVRQGGAIILCAALGDGHGGEAFYRWFAERPDADAVMRDIENVPAEETTADQWQAQILARVMQKATCWFVTGEESRAELEAMHFRWAPDPDTALAEATAMLGEKSTVTVIPDGVGVLF